MSEKNENEKENSRLEVNQNEAKTEEEEVEELMRKSLREQAEKKVAESQPISKKELEEELKKIREENEEMRELLTRAKAQHRAIIKQKEADRTGELKKIYKGTVLEGYL